MNRGNLSRCFSRGYTTRIQIPCKYYLLFVLIDDPANAMQVERYFDWLVGQVKKTHEIDLIQTLEMKVNRAKKIVFLHRI